MSLALPQGPKPRGHRWRYGGNKVPSLHNSDLFEKVC